jgi:hypothetical protein
MFVIRVAYPGGHSVWLTRRFPTAAWGPEKDALSFPTQTDAARTQKLFLDQHHEIVRNIRIRVFDRYFEVETEPSVDLRFKGWELGYGPVNACFGV